MGFRGAGEGSEGDRCVVGLLELLLLLLVLELTLLLIDGVREFSVGCLPGLGASLTLGLVGGGPRGGGRWLILQVVAGSVERRGCSATGLSRG